MNTREYHQANRMAWNEAAAQYERDEQERTEYLRKGGKNLMEPELHLLTDLNQWCKRAIHLQCAGGTDTLSLWNHGAHEVIGIDISDRMIEVAERKTAALNAPARWYRCDILDTPAELNGTADLVYTGRGALNWLNDLDAWADVILRLLKPGGLLFVFEGHPMANIWSMEGPELRLDPDPRYGNYFHEGAIEDTSGWPTVYIPADVVPPVEQQAKKYEHLWTMGHILTALAQSGLQLERLEEYPLLYWDGLKNLPPEIRDKLPNTFALMMRKP
jgi:SAM-dependent methyltransferase